MTEPATIASDVKPRLARGVRLVESEAQGGLVLLAPERIFKPDPVAADILGRCTGEQTMAELIDALAAKYAAPREKVEADVSVLLRSLADKRLLEL